jgi:hypothetical protein
MQYESDFYTNSYFALEGVSKGSRKLAAGTGVESRQIILEFDNKPGNVLYNINDIAQDREGLFAEEAPTPGDRNAQIGIMPQPSLMPTPDGSFPGMEYWRPGAIGMEYWRPGVIGMEYWTPEPVGMEYWRPQADVPSPGQIGIMPQPSLMPTPGGGGISPIGVMPQPSLMPTPGGGSGGGTGPAPRTGGY